jgi:general secretion pathway protein C
MALILAGVIADPDPAKGVAIIGENAASGKLYSVGAAIQGGAHLHAVYSDRVLLERNGGLETLMLPRTSASGRQASAAPAGAAVRGPGTREPASLLAGLVRVQPVFNQGKLQGYRIFPGGTRGASAFTQLGLKSGDMIEAVNGTALDDAGRAMEVLQTLSSSAAATVTVSRNGQRQEVNLNLANLNLDESPDSGSPDKSGAATTPAGPAGEPMPGPSAGGTGYHGHPGPSPNLSTAPASPAGSAGNINAAAGADAPAAPPASGSSERDR